MAQHSSLSRSDGQLHFLVYGGLGAVAGGAASWLTSPFDLVKLRVQVDRAKWVAGTQSFGFNYTSTLHGFKCIWREGGLFALWKGAMARVAFSAPSAAITISSFEWLKHRISTRNRR